MTVRSKLLLMCACIAGIELAAAIAETSFSRHAAKHQLRSRQAHEELEQLFRIDAGLGWELKKVDDLDREWGGAAEFEQLLQSKKKVDVALEQFEALTAPDRTRDDRIPPRTENHAEFGKRIRTFQASVDDMAARIQSGKQVELGTIEVESRATLPWVARLVAQTKEQVLEQDAAAARWSSWSVTAAWAAPLLSGLVLISAFVLLLRSISHPLADLAVGASRVAGGDLQMPVPVRSKDELGQLAAAFNGMLLSLRDRIKERDVALRDARFRDLSEAAPVAIAEVDRRGHPLYTNRRWIELTGDTLAPDRPWSTLVDEADRERAEKLQDAAAGEAVELRLHGGERTVWVVAQMAPLGPEHGDRSILALADITMQKNAITRAEELGRELMIVSRQAGMAEVSAGVLHNVGNVLNSILVAAGTLNQQLGKSRITNLVKAAQLLEENVGDLGAFLSTERGRLVPGYLVQAASSVAQELEASREDLTRIAKGTEHIRAIITTQQNYAKPGAHNEELQLSEIVEDVLTMNRMSFDRDHVRIAMCYEVDPILFSDRHRIMQILINLIGNARHALQDAGAQEHPAVEISTRLTAEGKVALAVADNGVGIAPENLARIFQHGFTTRKTGRGFGLHSSAQAAREMGGQLTVASAGVGQGATFTLELPLTPRSAAQPAAGRTRPAQSESTGPDLV